MERVLRWSRYTWRGLHGGCRELLDCAWILSPALLYARDLFFESFILIKISLGLRGLCVCIVTEGLQRQGALGGCIEDQEENQECVGSHGRRKGPLERS